MLEYNREPEFEIRKHLATSEELIWSGIPKQGIIFNSFDFILIPFSLVWGGFAFVWEFLAIKFKAPLYSILFGIPFVIVGVYLIIGRFFIDKYRRQYISYGLTKNHIVILSGKQPNAKIQKISLAEINKMELTNLKNNFLGTIIFNPPHDFKNINTSLPQGKGAKPVIIFENIPQAKEVYKKLLALQNTKHNQL